MIIIAFKQGIAAGRLSDSLIRNPVEIFPEVREQVVTHIEAEEAMLRKKENSHSRKPNPKP